MIVSNDGIIDGIGKTFIELFGIEAIRLPFNMICSQSPYIVGQALSNHSDKICLAMYNVKDLDV